MTCVIFPSVLVSLESTLDCEELSKICEQWLWWRSKRSVSHTWLQRWSRVNWMQLLFTRIYVDSLGQSIEDAWILSAAASPVSHFQLVDSEEQPKIHDTCGPSSNQGLLFSDQASASSRMLTESLPQSRPDTTLFSTMSSATWKKWVSERRQVSLLQRKLELHTYEKDGSSLGWRTPCSADWKNMDKANQIALSSQVRWPTPDVTMRPHEGNVRLLRKGVENGMDKAEADAMLGRDISKPQGKLGPLDPVNSSTNQSRQGQLNPDWVDMLMGFPIGWTDLEPWATQ